MEEVFRLEQQYYSVKKKKKASYKFQKISQ